MDGQSSIVSIVVIVDQLLVVVVTLVGLICQGLVKQLESTLVKVIVDCEAHLPSLARAFLPWNVQMVLRTKQNSQNKIKTQFNQTF